MMGSRRQKQILKSVFYDKALAAGKCPVIYLSSALEGIIEQKAQEDAEKLNASSAISDSLTKIIARINEKPDCVVAKGGITSSDIATKGLGIKNAEVMGQVLPGVPAIMTGRKSKWPSIPYVIFPGNVGEKDSLKQIYELIHNP